MDHHFTIKLHLLNYKLFKINNLLEIIMSSNNKIISKLCDYINTNTLCKSLYKNYFYENIKYDFNDKLDKIILELLNNLENNNPSIYKFYNSNINLDYDDFINIWKNFVDKIMMEINSDILLNFNNLNYNKSSLKISLFENNLSFELEKIFNFHLDCIEDNLILIYIKNHDNLLLFYKSYIPLIKLFNYNYNNNDIRLPFWEYLIKNEHFIFKFTQLFQDNENICIITFQINNFI